MPLGVGWLEALGAGFDPDLEEVNFLVAGGIELRVGDAEAGAHELDLAGLELAAISHAVFVSECAGDDIAEDFHVAVGVCGKSATGCDAVLIDDAEAAEAHVGGIVVVGEAEAEPAVEPAVIGVSAVGGFAKGCFHVVEDWHGRA